MCMSRQFASKFQRKLSCSVGSFPFPAWGQIMYRGSPTWSRLCSSCSHAKRPKKASPTSNNELLIPGFSYPLWMHPFLKSIVRSPKKALERHQNHCVAVIASNFVQLTSTELLFQYHFKSQLAQKIGPFLDLLCITLGKKMFYKSSAPLRLSGNLFVLRCFLHWDYTALTRIGTEGTGVKSHLHNSETSTGLLFKVAKLYSPREVEGLCKQTDSFPTTVPWDQSPLWHQLCTNHVWKQFRMSKLSCTWPRARLWCSCCYLQLPIFSSTLERELFYPFTKHTIHDSSVCPLLILPCHCFFLPLKASAASGALQTPPIPGPTT